MPLSRGCLFVHIPKCAGTSIEVALGIADDYPELGRAPTTTVPHIRSLFGGGLQHLTVREMRRNYPEIAARPTLFTFSVVRDPIDRFLSHVAWKHFRFSDRRVDEGEAKRVLAAEVDALADFARAAVFRRPFAGYEYCETDPPAIEPNDVKRHLIPQCAYLFDDGIVRVDSVYAIEAIDALEEDLRDRGALAAPIPHRMVGAQTAALRGLLPANVGRAIEEIYRHDVELHARVRAQAGACAGPAVASVARRAPPASAATTADNVAAPVCPRRLWLYWHQGWDNAPELARNCLANWRRRNPAWQVDALSWQTLGDFVRIPGLYGTELSLPLPALSDIIRVYLLSRYGGVWADASTWCARPLDEWIDGVLSASGFFAYAAPAPDRPISTWFLAAARGHYITEALKADADELWRRVAEKSITLDVTDDPGSKDYFWVHRIFANRLATDPEMAALWAKTPRVSALTPHYLQKVGMLHPATDDVMFHVRNKLTNVYKLDRRMDLPTRLEGSVLGTLFATLSAP